MKTQRLTIALTALNLVLLLFTLAQSGRADSQAVAPVLRGRVLELLDDRGQVRSRLNVEPSGGVVFRLMDKNGTIRVKLGADEHGSGLVLLDETTAPGVQIIASQTGTPDQPATTSLALTGADGRQRTIKP
jgi:hypothetical protein